MARSTQSASAATSLRSSPEERRLKASKTGISKYEYRFDLVPEDEQADCLCWESIRELCRLSKKPVPLPWRRLEVKTKSPFRKMQKIEAAYVAPVDYRWPIHTTITVDGKRLTSVELVSLPQVKINWDCTDKELLDALRNKLDTWLAEQRKANPNARYFSAKAKRGTRQNLLKKLADLAIYRLKRHNWSEDDIDSALQELYKKIDPVAARKADEAGVLVKSGKVGNRNLSATVDRASKALRNFERQFSNFIGRREMQRTLSELFGSRA
jgi:hypothetical protein